jgi:DNA-binding XRE family transcriptional regulator
VSKAKKAKAVRPEGSRLAEITLSKDMPGGVTTKDHPLIWLVDNKMPKGTNKSDLARHLGVRPQSLYKWERLCKVDRNFPVPAPRALQIAKFFRVRAGLLRPDLFGA